MEERINTEALGEDKQHIPEKKNEVQKVEMFLEELLVARYNNTCHCHFTRVCYSFLQLQ